MRRGKVERGINMEVEVRCMLREMRKRRVKVCVERDEEEEREGE